MAHNFCRFLNRNKPGNASRIVNDLQRELEMSYSQGRAHATPHGRWQYKGCYATKSLGRGLPRIRIGRKSLLLIMGSHESNWETKADADILRRMAAYLQLSVDQILVISGAKDQRKEFRDPFGKTN